jgi:hypothetical protein
VATGTANALRDEIENAAQDESIDPSARLRMLSALRGDLVSVLGACDQYIGALERHAQSLAAAQRENVEIARRFASLREGMIEEGVATGDELDLVGILSEAELDQLEEEGLLLEAVGYLRKKWDEALHPRGRGGQFVAKPGAPEAPKIRKSTYGTDYQAVGPGGEIAVRGTRKEAEDALKGIRSTQVKRDPGTGKGDTGTKPYQDPTTTELLTDPETVREARKMILSGNPTTRDRYATVKDGKVVYDRSRQKLHKEIIEKLLTEDGEHQAQEHPVAFFTGGGMASGKGGVVDAMNGGKGHEWKPQDAVTIDPDKVKALMPEFAQLTNAGDPEANIRVSDEAWDISQALAAEVRKRKYNVIVDGVGNTSADMVRKRVDSYVSAGYTPRAVYVATPAPVAVRNARMRMQKAIKAGKLESIRYIPDEIMYDTHARVSKVFPDILKMWPGEIELYDTNTWDEEKKVFHTPRLLLKKSGKGEEPEILDNDTYEKFLEKARNPYVEWFVPPPEGSDDEGSEVAV